MEEIDVKTKPITWDDTGLVIFLDGYAYTALFLNGHGEADHIRLGEEDLVKSILAGQKPISEAKGMKQQMALQEILESKEDQDARPTETRGRSLQRGRSGRTLRRGQKDPERLKARKRLSRR